jgi:hypothetical protein
MTGHVAASTRSTRFLRWHTPKIVNRQWNLHGHLINTTSIHLPLKGAPIVPYIKKVVWLAVSLPFLLVSPEKTTTMRRSPHAFASPEPRRKASAPPEVSTEEKAKPPNRSREAILRQR